MTGALKRAAAGPRPTTSRELRMLMPLQAHHNIVEVLACACNDAGATAMLTRHRTRMLTRRYRHCRQHAIDHFKLEPLRAYGARAAKRLSPSGGDTPPPGAAHATHGAVADAARARARALLFMHNSGVVHMDLKPDNLTLDEHSQPVIIDYGCALSLRAGKLVKFPMGTPGYTSPEVEAAFTTPPLVIASMDVYSFGVFVAEAAVGMPAKDIRQL